jgi:DNA invertase Pin-like site-specific DNA recombinase
MGVINPKCAADPWVEWMDENGISFKSITESIDTSTSGGKLILSIFGAIAEFERNLIRERTKAGLAAARGRSRLGGRPKNLMQRKWSWLKNSTLPKNTPS